MRKYFRLGCEWLAQPHVAAVMVGCYCGLLFATGAVELAQPLLGLSSILYLVSQLLLIAIAGSVGHRFGLRGATPVQDDSAAYCQWIAPLAVVNVVALLVSLIDYFTVDLIGKGTTLFDVRSAFDQREVTVMSYLSNLLTPSALVTTGILIFYYERVTPFLRLAGFVSSLAVVLGISIGQGGRVHVFNYVLLTGWWAMARVAAGKPNILRRRGLIFTGSALVVGMLCSFMWISIARSYYKEDQGAALLSFVSKSVVPAQPILEATQEMNPALANGIYEALLYWTISVGNWDKLFHNWTVPPTYVSVLSPVLERRLDSFGLIPAHNTRADEYKSILSAYRIPSNTWGTVSFEFLETFGAFGGVLATSSLAFGAGFLFARSKRSRSFFGLFLASMAWLMFALWFQRSVTYEPICEYGIYWAGLFLFFRRCSAFRTQQALAPNQRLSKHATGV
ncbi:MAG: hypothetical protein AB9869_26780 [Verrucomicrobiia bacterium]